MVMFEERPYRQRKQSLWSIWWFVGLMACGLTAWHLELYPLVLQYAARDSSEDETLVEHEEVLDAPFAKSAIPESESAQRQFDFEQQEQTLGKPEFLPSTNSSVKLKPASMESSQVPRSAAGKSFGIQQASYEQPAPEPNNPKTNTPGPYFNSKSEYTPVKTLTYRRETEPVNPRYIPAAKTGPPIQYATASRVTNPVSRPINQTITAGYSKPVISGDVPTNSFELSPESEQDILRHRQLSSQYWQHPEKRSEISIELEQLDRDIYFSPEKNYFPSYEVQPNDQLRLIARNYDLSWEYLANLNRTKPEQIRSGQKLKVLKGPFNAVIDLHDYRITIHAHGYYVCSFPIGTGKDGATPTGKYPILNKEQNPTYYGSSNVIGRDDPMNPLGEHWIDLGNSYGIHGTINPESIGQSVSKGCIRMHNADVAQVYDLLTLKSVVTIRK